MLWSLVRNRSMDGLKFRRQTPIGAYIVDFVCAAARLAVELDGGQHAADDQRRYDADRTSFLERQGLLVLRFWNHELLQDPEVVLEAIWLAAQGRLPHPDPLPQAGEGGCSL